MSVFYPSSVVFTFHFPFPLVTVLIFPVNPSTDFEHTDQQIQI